MTVLTVKDLTDGEMLGGKYRIGRVLGQGGMGVVVEAVHVELDDRVAIKFLTPRALAEPDAVQRFVREAKAAVRLRSEHIARVRDVGMLPGGDPYIVMEYLDGVELRHLFSGPRLAPPALVDLILQACEGLAEAHSHGIVHRDIKPSNLFIVTQVDGAPHVKVLDFGVSKVPLDDLNLTGTNSWMGTPAYMSPEQMRSTKNVDARSDLWSLSVVLYEGLEGRVPFPGDSLADLCINVTSMPPQPLTSRTPAGLASIVMKGLAKSPADRYESAASLAEALAPFAETPSHAEMIVRRTRGLERRATPATGGPERVTGPRRVVPSAPTDLLSPRPNIEHAVIGPASSSTVDPTSDDDVAPLGAIERRRSRRWLAAGVLVVATLAFFVVQGALDGRSHDNEREGSDHEAERRAVESPPDRSVEPPPVVGATMDASAMTSNTSVPDASSVDAAAETLETPTRRPPEPRLRTTTPDPRRTPSPPVDAGVQPPVDAAQAPPADASPPSPPDADPFGRRT